MNDKQIDELDRIIDNCVKGGFSSCEISKYLYEKGYRKQSDTVKEFAEKIIGKIDKISCCGQIEEETKTIIEIIQKSPLRSAGRTTMNGDKLIEAIRNYIKKGLTNGIVYQSGEHGFVDSSLLADHLLPLINAEIEAQKHRADVAEEALEIACEEIDGLINKVRSDGFSCRLKKCYKQAAIARLKELEGDK